ncbi:low molecular weight phosphotyrosine protein phosphatase [Leptospira ognonensis]|uniref:Low molecular weight phosphotyrosine protein phosphatase n=1 Tax=Leptospira ognonensis TaxID=2484945 RepID=A0A4R9K6E1_9LEPT|nr:low molecular weight protein-tyrosine-phosphatase [Leptospira ognonensis]TGL61825.1 low molecular weight phosphotyrosine protein phosphatase [Leptospira ognonensis]
METKNISQIRILFVCLGNICRSPIAEATFKHLVKTQNMLHLFEIDSAGTAGYHVGELADPRTRKVAESVGLELDHLSRQFKMEDFERFDYILAMDKSNAQGLSNLARNREQIAKISLFRAYEKEARSLEVPDPYYGDTAAFIKVQSIVEHASKSFLNFLIKKHGLAYK